VRDNLVAVDLETTGLNPDYDRIIEIGALKFEGAEVIDEWETLIDPGSSIPLYITHLTGIRDQDVQSAPRLAEVLPELREFIGGATIVGHNVSFDLAFLRRAGIARANSSIDTYALASALLPATARYNLTALTSMIGMPVEDAHRALDDCRGTMALYNDLWQRAMALPLDVLAEIVRLGQQVTWGAELVFEAALRERQAAGEGPTGVSDLPAERAIEDWFDSAVEDYPSLRPRREPLPLDLDELDALIQPGGPLSERLPAYEYRPQQIQMQQVVAGALNEGRHVMIEAPTGVGKSLAYLVPAALYAAQNDSRVVISTNTINLQDQLVQKDIPIVLDALDLPVRAAVLKGRGNYLCPRRLAALRRRGPTSPEEMQVLAKVLVWLTQNQSGDRNELTLRGPVEDAIWRRLSAEDEGCTLERCITQMGGTCPFYRARRRAESAHLLIVNHALLLSDVAAEGRVLPDYGVLIVDEAHHLEDAITNSMMFRTGPEAIQRQIAELGSANSGLLGDLLAQTEGAIPEGYHATLRDFVAVIVEASGAMTHHVDWFFRTLRRFLEEHVHIPRSSYTQEIRILAPLRRQPGWGEVETRWDNLSQFTGAISDAMMRLAQGLTELYDYDIEEFDDLVAAMSSTARHLVTLHERLQELVLEPDDNTIYWVAFQPDGSRISIHTAPLDIGPMVEEHLWLKKDTVIMTSATLRTDDTFDFIRERLDALDVGECVIDSPFDYEESTLLYLVNDIPEPGQRDAYQQAVERGLIDLCRATEGRTIALFTSYAQLRQTANAISEPLAKEGIVVYDQSDGTSRSQLLEGFVKSEKAVLLGTRSFWEGVDVPGADLSVLVIVRLPFSVPSDPLFAARSERFDNPFYNYALPETVLRFRQGFGRLIRRRSDRGVVAIFDRRVLSKRYGSLFLQALPTCTVREGSLSALPAAAAAWIEQEGESGLY
jgi:ATP-dependent DNA helicase DinG